MPYGCTRMATVGVKGLTCRRGTHTCVRGTPSDAVGFAHKRFMNADYALLCYSAWTERRWLIYMETIDNTPLSSQCFGILLRDPSLGRQLPLHSVCLPHSLINHDNGKQ